MKKCVRTILIIVSVTVIPCLSEAQTGGGIADNIHGLQSVLDQLYSEMLPLCSQLIGVGRGIAGFAALCISVPVYGGILPVLNRWIFILCYALLLWALRY